VQIGPTDVKKERENGTKEGREREKDEIWYEREREREDVESGGGVSGTAPSRQCWAPGV
jgi:hypothetical protein